MEHAPALAKFHKDNPGIMELCAVCDKDIRKAESFRELFGFKRAYVDFEEMFRKEKPDGCVCIMPVGLIAEMGIRIMRRHIPVLLEKPLGRNMEEARGLVEAAKETGVFNMVSVNRRFDPLLTKALRWVRRQGAMRYVHGQILRHKRIEPEFVWGTAIHAIDAMRHIAGDALDYKSTITADKSHEIKWHHLDFEFANNVFGGLEVFPTCGAHEEKYEIFGENFRAEASLGNYLRYWRDGKPAGEEYSDRNAGFFVNTGTYGETAEFINALLCKRAPKPSVSDVLQSVEICSNVRQG